MTVSLFCSVTATHSVLAPILEAFRVTHSSVEIKMHTGDQADGIVRILEGEKQDDIAVSGRPARLPPASGVFASARVALVHFCAPASSDCLPCERCDSLAGRKSVAGIFRLAVTDNMVDGGRTLRAARLKTSEQCSFHRAWNGASLKICWTPGFESAVSGQKSTPR